MTEVVAICSHSLDVENGVCAFRHDVSGASDVMALRLGLASTVVGGRISVVFCVVKYVYGMLM